MEKRIGVMGIVVESREKVAPKLNEILSEYGDIIIGRMGIPYREENISTIALIVEGSSDDIGALSGSLGNLSGITLKSALTSKVIKNENE